MKIKLSVCQHGLGAFLSVMTWVVLAAATADRELAAAQFSPTIVIAEGKTGQGFPYMFGGVGSDEREAMEARAIVYNVKLVFAEKRGAFVSGVSLAIGTAKGGEIVSLSTEGPWFYIQLPPGNYTVKARLKGELKESPNLTVPNDQRIQQSLVWDLAEQ